MCIRDRYEYDQDISDHRPVALKIFADSNLQTTDEMMAASFFTNSPNPIKTETNFTFKSKLDVDRIEIYTTKGQRISSLNIDKNQSSIPFNTSHLANGTYFANLISNNIAIASKKIVILK